MALGMGCWRTRGTASDHNHQTRCHPPPKRMANEYQLPPPSPPYYPFPRGKPVLRVTYGVLLWADTNAAHPRNDPVAGPGRAFGAWVAKQRRRHLRYSKQRLCCRAHVSTRRRTPAHASTRQHTPARVSTRRHASAHVSRLCSRARVLRRAGERVAAHAAPQHRTVAVCVGRLQFDR